MRQEFGNLFPAQPRGPVHQSRDGNGLRHLPELGFVRGLRIVNENILLPRLSFFWYKHQRDLARPLLFATQNGSIEQRVALTQMVDGAKRKALLARLNLKVRRPKRTTSRTSHKRRRFGSRSSRISSLRTRIWDLVLRVKETTYQQCNTNRLQPHACTSIRRWIPWILA